MTYVLRLGAAQFLIKKPFNKCVVDAVIPLWAQVLVFTSESESRIVRAAVVDGKNEGPRIGVAIRDP